MKGEESMKSIEWLDLKVRRYEDGEFEVYEALHDTRRTTKDARDLPLIIERMVRDMGREIENSEEEERQ